MKQNSGSSKATGPGRVRRALMKVLFALGGLMIVVVLVVGTFIVLGIPIQLDWLKGRIETAASEVLQRPVVIEGPLALVPSFPPAARVAGVRIGNPVGWPPADLVKLNSARVQLRVLPLLAGELVIDEVSVDGLDVNLETNPEGEPNWLLADSAPVAVPDEAPAPEAAEPALRFVELADLLLRDIVLKHHDAASGRDFTVELADITGSALDHEPMELLVQGAVQKIPYSLEANAGSLASLFAGDSPWPLEVTAEAVGARLELAGEIAEPLRARGLALGVNLSGPDMEELGGLLGVELPPIDSFDLSGRIEEEGGKYRVVDLSGEIAATGVTGSFEADLSGGQPRFFGDIVVLSIDVGPLLASIDAPSEAAEGDQAPPAEGAERAIAGEGIDLDEPLLKLEVMQKFEAQLGLTIGEVINGPAEMRDLSLEVNIGQGSLSSPMAITLAEVPFRGELRLWAAEGRPRMSVSLSGEQSDIGELASLLTQAEGVEGRFDKAQLDFSASGQSIRSLVDTAELRFSIEGGALSYGHDTEGTPVEFALDQADLLFPAADESKVSARGALLGEPFSFELRGGTFIENFVRRQWPLELEAIGGGAKLDLSGIIRRAEVGAGSELEFVFEGERIGELSAWLGINPEATQAYLLKGAATHTDSGLRLTVEQAEIGHSAFAGEAGIRRDEADPVTFARLDFSVLDLDGLEFLAAPSATDIAVDGSTEIGPEALTIEVPILPNGIEIFDSDIELKIDRIKLEPADITRFSFSSNIRDGYVDQAPVVAVVGGARFEGHFGIDLRGEVPKVGLAIGSRDVDVGTLLAQLGVVEGLAMQAGRFEMDAALEGASASEMLRRSTLSVGIEDGAWAFAPPGAEQALDIRIPKASVSASPGQPITLALDARLGETPVTISITTDTLGSFAEPKQALQMAVAMALANAEVKLTGAAPLPVRADNLHFALDLSGERFSDFDELLDVSLPPIGPYRFKGDFGSRGTGYYVQDLLVSVGESTLAGSLNLETGQQPPRLEVDLVAERIQLDDFDTGDWSPTGQDDDLVTADAAPEAEQALEADRERALLSPEVMRSIDARVSVEVEQVLSGRDRLGRGALTTTLGNGRLEVKPLELEVPGGSVDLGFALEPTEESVALEANARIEHLEYGILARRIDPESATGGVISVDVDLSTRGSDLEHILDEAEGHIDFGLWPNDLNAEVFEIWAVNVIASLMTEVDQDAGSRVNCLVASFQVEDGVMQNRVVYADTTRMRVEGGAEVDFKQRTFEIRAVPRAKRPEFFSLAVPVGLSGKFDDFGLNINPVALTGQAVSFLTSPVHVPIRRLFRRGEPADGAEACATAWEMRNASAEADGGE